MKNKKMRVNIDVSLDEIRGFYLENLNVMRKLLDAAKAVGDVLDVLAPICEDEEVPEVDEQANANEEWLKNLFSQTGEAGYNGNEEYPEDDDVEDGTEEDNDDEAEALAITLLKAVFQALSETFDEYK